MAIDSLLAFVNHPPPGLRQLAGIEGLYLVGGSLRDAFYGETSKDFDFACSGDVPRTADLIARELGGSAFELGARFGTWRVSYGEGEIDLSAMHPDGMTPDLARRDFTVNALAVACDKLGSINRIDELAQHDHSISDLDNRILRMISPDNLSDDPARIIRGYRIAAKAGLEIEQTTRMALSSMAIRVTDSAPERLHEELVRWFSIDRPVADSIASFAEDGVLWQLFPVLRDTCDCQQNAYHHLDVWSHTLLAIEEFDGFCSAIPSQLDAYADQLSSCLAAPVSAKCNGRGIVRLALLLHDIGKPASRVELADGHVTFHDHQQIGIDLAKPLLEQLKMSNVELDAIVMLIKEHLRLGFYSGESGPSNKLVYRFIRKLGDITPLMVLHGLADCAATRGPLSSGGYEQHLVAAEIILGHYFARDTIAKPVMWLDGAEIIAESGLAPGPKIGEIKEALAEAAAIGLVSSREQALIFVRRYLDPL